MSEDTYPDPSYNKVFETLVEGRDDLVGLVAYALYKWHKREWLLRLRGQREPMPSDEEAFLATVFADLDSYKERAKKALVQYGEAYVDDVRPQIAVEAIEGRISDVALRVEKSGAWTKQIGVGVVSSIVTTALLVLVAIGVQASGIDFIDFIRAFDNHHIVK